jgi:acyl-coenzyme A thioesterase PaaI-like protein
MPTEVEPTSQRLQRIRREIHPHCVVCGPENLRGLHVCWTVLPEGSVEAVYVCPRRLEGYGHTVHGGIICSLLDGAMTNCLFAHGCVGMTAELKVRFHHPVAVEQPVVVRARITDTFHQLYYLSAELQQDGRSMATATAKFLEQSNGRE